MSKFRTLLRVATAAGPAIYTVVRASGPQLRAIIEENPELFEKIKTRLSALAGQGKPKHGIGGINERIVVLREQTTYLYASANNVAVAKQATAWRTELDSLEAALPVINAMSSKQRKQQVRTFKKRIDELSAKILALTLEDDIEDAEIIDEHDVPNA